MKQTSAPLSEMAERIFAQLSALGPRGVDEGMAFDVEFLDGARFEDQPDVLALRELEAAGVVTIDNFDPDCWTLGAKLRP